MRALTIALFLAAVCTPLAAMTVEEFSDLEFAAIIAEETTPSGAESVVVGAAGQVDGEDRVGIGLFVEGEPRPQLLAYFFLDPVNDPVICQQAADADWICRTLDGRNADFIRRDLQTLRAQEFGHPERPGRSS